LEVPDHAGNDQDGQLIRLMARLFFALWPEPSVRDALAHQVASGSCTEAGAAPTRAENLHLTLAFLGAVPDPRLDEVLAVAASIRAAPFALTLDRQEYWAEPGIFCLVPSIVHPSLIGLARDIASGLQARALPVEQRTYRPHVTLCRKSRKAAELPDPVPQSSVTPIEWPVREFVLAESADDRGGSRYRITARWPLQ